MIEQTQKKLIDVILPHCVVIQNPETGFKEYTIVDMGEVTEAIDKFYETKK